MCPYQGQPYVVDEYGGTWWDPNAVETEQDADRKSSWGYGKRPTDIEEVYHRIEKLTAILLDHPNIAGYCYTQLTDIEQEQNGIYTYDRREKFNAKRLKKIFWRPGGDRRGVIPWTPDGKTSRTPTPNLRPQHIPTAKPGKENGRDSKSKSSLLQDSGQCPKSPRSTSTSTTALNETGTPSKKPTSRACPTSTWAAASFVPSIHNPKSPPRHLKPTRTCTTGPHTTRRHILSRPGHHLCPNGLHCLHVGHGSITTTAPDTSRAHTRKKPTVLYTGAPWPHKQDNRMLWNIGILGFQLWNSIRALDFLCELPEVDTNRLGCTGESGGGTQTYNLYAVDDRLHVAAPVCMVSAYMQGGCVCENAPLLRIDTNNVDIGATFAPKPLILVSSSQDWTQHTPDVEYPAIKRIYDLYDADDRISQIQIDAPHGYNLEMREAVYRWFARWLDLPFDDNFSEPPFEVEEHKDMLAFFNGLPDGAITQHADLIRQCIAASKTALETYRPNTLDALAQKSTHPGRSTAYHRRLRRQHHHLRIQL